MDSDVHHIGVFSKFSVTTIGKALVDEKLLLAAPRIGAQNYAMTGAMLAEIKATTAAATPIGPGHFGYHGRDTLRAQIQFVGETGTHGVLYGAIQLYWREFGTRSHYRGKTKIRRYVAAVQGFTGGDDSEPAFMTAHKAAGGFKRIVKAYYGGLANWWRA